METFVGITLSICLIIIVIVGVAFKINTDYDIGCLKSKVDWFQTLYHNLDNRWGDIYDIIKKQQEEIKELRRMIELKEAKRCCCSNCKFFHELNDQDSVCLNINNYRKSDPTIYADGKSITWGAIKRVEPKDCCAHYEPKENRNESD